MDLWHGSIPTQRITLRKLEGGLPNGTARLDSSFFSSRPHKVKAQEVNAIQLIGKRHFCIVCRMIDFS
jgi:hypothetical protein